MSSTGNTGRRSNSWTCCCKCENSSAVCKQRVLPCLQKKKRDEFLILRFSFIMHLLFSLVCCVRLHRVNLTCLGLFTWCINFCEKMGFHHVKCSGVPSGAARCWILLHTWYGSFQMRELLLLHPGRLYRFMLVCGLGWGGVFYFCTKSAGEQQRVFDVPCCCNIGFVDVRAKPSSSLPFPRVTAAGCCQSCAERRGVGLITHWHWMQPIVLAIRPFDWTNRIRILGSLLKKKISQEGNRIMGLKLCFVLLTV